MTERNSGKEGTRELFATGELFAWGKKGEERKKKMAEDFAG